MTLLKNPGEVTSVSSCAILIYGIPGIGKTTLALSAPMPVCIDAENGMRRVERRFQVTSLPLTNYADLLELLESPELEPFETIVFDTLGRLIERISDHLAADNAVYRQKDGALSIKGFGRLKVEFQRLLRMARDRHKHLVFVAHDREERDGDTRIIRPDGGPGSAGKDLIKDLDAIGYMEASGNDRTISFSPCERFYAKNALQLPSVIKVPDTKHGNTFLRDYLFAKAAERMVADEEENERYNALVDDLRELIGRVADADQADKVLAHIQSSPVIWDSLRIARRALADKVAELGLTYDRTDKKFVKPKVETVEEKAAPLGRGANHEESVPVPNAA